MSACKLVVTFLIGMFLFGCGRPQIPAGEETKYLFGLKTGETLGDKNGAVALREDGIFIHPGDTLPTIVKFDLNDKYESIKLKPFIAKLNAEGEKHAEAGTVGVDILLDGKSADKFPVDRNSNLQKIFNVKGVKFLEIRVDNGGSTGWDWFIVKVLSIN